MQKELQDSNTKSSKKRVKERSVIDALNRVREWRRIYEEGKSQQNTNQPRISLQEAANLVKIPKKTLEDYIQIFNKVSLICQIEDFSNKRMGFLRAFIEKNKAIIKTAAQIRKQIKKECVDVKNEDSFQNILKIEFENMSNIKQEDLYNEKIYEAKLEIKEEESEYQNQKQF
ncbi:unnamed protein product [Paramecium primaurelia]|uniref:Uncharacterized protein n=1 Tax=Paramecium primaurelia TaxID=5886 RepID=A0A8S1LE15_PARPR|nr:unnamed protein product [Paramecium primaurelia]